MSDRHELREDNVERRVDGRVHAIVASACEDLFEGATKLPAEATVYQRVEHGVHMAEPSENGEDKVLVGETVFAGDDKYMEDEEGRPAGDEAADDDAQRTGGPLLLHILHQMTRALFHRLLTPSQAQFFPRTAVHRRRPLALPFVVRVHRL